jgi:hypothetical protein
MGPAHPGQIANNSTSKDIRTMLNKSNTSLAAGIAVKFGGVTPTGGAAVVGAPIPEGGSLDGQTATILTASTDQIAGITCLTFASDPYNIAGTATYREGTTMDVLRKGSIFVAAEQACSPGDSVNVRFQAVAGNTVIGAFTNTPDGGTRPVKGAAWVSKSVSAPGTNLEGSAQNIAELDFDALTDQATH